MPRLTCFQLRLRGSDQPVEAGTAGGNPRQGHLNRAVGPGGGHVGELYPLRGLESVTRQNRVSLACLGLNGERQGVGNSGHGDGSKAAATAAR